MQPTAVNPQPYLQFEETSDHVSQVLRDTSTKNKVVKLPIRRKRGFIEDGDVDVAKSLRGRSVGSIVTPLRKTFKNIVLPLGYPHSTPPEYTEFQLYNILQDFCSYLRAVMSTQAVLEGFGVGRSDVTSVQATVNWIIRDGASLLGSLLFTGLSSADFGMNVKSWRYFADTINNVGITLDMLAPLTRRFFLPLICIGSVCKALCGVAAGAAGAAISEHWGQKKGNIADVLAKNSAQHTIVSLIGLIFSIPFTKFANASRRRLWTIYSVLTVLHMMCNYRCMKLLSLRSINETRLRILVSLYLDNEIVNNYLNHEFTAAVKSQILPTKCNPKPLRSDQSSIIDRNQFTLREIAKRERICYPILPKVVKGLLGESEKNLVRIEFSMHPSRSIREISITQSELVNAFKEFKNKPYVLLYSKPKDQIKIVLKESVSVSISDDCLEALIAAGVYRKITSSLSLPSYSTRNSNSSESDGYDSMGYAMKFSSCVSSSLAKEFKSLLSSCDYDLNRINIVPPSIRRIRNVTFLEAV